MASTGERPPARPLFRKLAVGMAVVCFILAAVFGIVPDENKLLGVLVCLFVGFVTSVIGTTGYWPPRPRQ
jgi:hypothetical protein